MAFDLQWDETSDAPVLLEGFASGLDLAAVMATQIAPVWSRASFESEALFVAQPVQDAMPAGLMSCGCLACSGDANALAPQMSGQPSTNAVVSDFTALLAASWYDQGATGRSVFLTYSFDTAAADYLTSFYSESGLATFQTATEEIRVIARAAFDAWASVSGITMFEVPSGEGDMRVNMFDLAALGNSAAAGFAYYPSGLWDSPISGDIFIRTEYNTATPLSWMPHLFLHEIGHALGFKHPFDGSTTLATELDNYNNTVMSYTSGGTQGNELGPFDIQAAQHIYGTNAQDGTHVSAWNWNAAERTLSQTGFAANDGMSGTDARDIMDGDAGNDTLSGRGGNDTLSGGLGNDLIRGGRGNDSMSGGDGADTFESGTGHDTMDGGAGNDLFWVGSRNSVVRGGDGNDFTSLRLGPSDVFNINGGAGNDTLQVEFIDPGAGNTMTYSMATALAALSRIEQVEQMFIYGLGERANAIEGSALNEYLVGGTLNDTLSGGAGNDLFSLGNGNDVVHAGDGNDTIFASSGADSVNGDGGDDQINARTGGTYTGGAGNDRFWVEVTASGGVNFDGGEGNDSIDFSLTGTVGAVTVFSLDARVAAGGLLTNIERVTISGAANVANDLTGGAANDTLWGNTANDTLSGLGGIDYLAGANGDDRLIAGAGDDSADGAAGNDWISGGGGNDLMWGGDGNDTLMGGLGADSMSAGGGWDLVSYQDESSAVTVTINGARTLSEAGLPSGAQEFMWDVEALEGSAFGDALTGNSAANSLSGLGGNDTLNGGGGADTLFGGTGTDTLIGGDGMDVAVVDGARTAWQTRASVSGGLTTMVFTDPAGGAGSKTITGVETLRLSSGDFAVAGIQQNDVSNMDGGRFDDLVLVNVAEGRVAAQDMGATGPAGFYEIFSGLGATWRARGTGDASGDGRADLFVQSTANGEVRLINTAPGAAVSTSLFANITADYVMIAQGDLTGDGTIDALLRRASDGFMVYADLGPGAVFERWVNAINVGTTDWRTIGLGDFDRDGVSDIAIQHTVNGLTYFANFDTGGTQNGWGYIAGGLGTTWIGQGAADFNGDGFDEMVFQNSTNGSVWFVNIASGGLTGQWGVVANNLSGWTVEAFADYDNDGFDDMLIRQTATGVTLIADMDNGTFTGWDTGSNAGTAWIVV